MWLIGQAVALRELSWRLAQNQNANEATKAQWRALVWLLSKVEPTIVESDYATAQTQADALARRIARENLDAGFTRRLTSDLAASELPAGSNEIAFHCAQRLFLALQSLTRGDAKISQQLNDLHATVRTETQFDRAEFSAHLATFRRAAFP